MYRKTIVVAFALLLISRAGAPRLWSQSQKGGDIAVVVNPATPVDELTMADVRRVFLGERQYWKSDLPVILLVRAPVARERDVVLKTIYQMSEGQFRQYWIGKVFRAETSSGPKIVYSNEMIAELVASIPGSIGFVDASNIPKGVKVVKTNGLMPGDKGYPLR